MTLVAELLCQGLQWLLTLPAGVGLATARSCLRLWLGFPPGRSGVWSAGNGPCMRSPLIGALFADDPQKRRTFVAASTRITHTDPRAEIAAQALADAAAWIVQGRSSTDFLVKQLEAADHEEWRSLLQAVRDALARGDSVPAFAQGLGGDRGISGYAFHTAPAALFAWLRYGADYRRAVEETIAAGGDTDTAGAIVGALCGLAGGEDGIPHDWQSDVRDFPRGLAYGRRLAVALAQGSRGAVSWFWPAQLPRNLLFLAVVLAHGFRRLWPV